MSPNPYIQAGEGGSSSSSRPVMTGYTMQETGVPFYLRPPGSGGDVLSGSYAMPSSLQVGSGVETEMPEYATQDQLLQGLATLDAQDPEAYRDLEKKLELTKFRSWSDFFESASYADMPWDEYLDFRIETDSGLYGRGGGGGPTSQVNLSSESEAGAMLDQAFTAYLGRTANDEEVATWTQLLNEAQRANPTVNSGGPNNVTTGGFNPTRYAREYAQSQEGYAERFAAVNFMNALDSLLAGGGNALDEFAESM